MSLSIEDLKPTNFKITVKGVELECKPLKLSHQLVVASIGEVFKNLKDANVESIKKAESELDIILPEIIPALKDVELDGGTVMEIITKIMTNSQPSDVQFLEKNGVELNSDPKVERAG